MREFLAMGGYAAFLWPAYLVTVIALIANVVSARSALRHARSEAARRVGDEASERGAAGSS